MLNVADRSPNLTMSPPDLTMSRTLATLRKTVLEDGWVQTQLADFKNYYKERKEDGEFGKHVGVV